MISIETLHLSIYVMHINLHMTFFVLRMKTLFFYQFTMTEFLIQNVAQEIQNLIKKVTQPKLHMLELLIVL